MGDFKGGRVSIEIGGDTYSARASVKIEPSAVMVTSEANQDGSMHSYVAPKLIMAEIMFDRGDPSRMKWDAGLLTTIVNLSVTETDARVQHLMTGATWNGTPSLDTEKGEISGLKFACPGSGYQQLTF